MVGMNGMKTGSLTFNFIVTVLLLSATAAGLKVSQVRVPGALAQPLETVPATLGDWTMASQSELPDRILQTLHATSYLDRIYSNGRNQLGLFVAYYSEQRAGESIHTPKHCLPGGGLEVVDIGTVDIPFAGSKATVNKYIVDAQGQRLLILYWYHSKSRIIANEYAAKFYLARDALLRGNTDGSIVRITLRDQPGALQHAVDFATHVLPAVQYCFRPTDRSEVASRQR